MRIQDFLPFSAHARLLNSRYERAKVSDLVFPRGLSLPEGISQQDVLDLFVIRQRAIPVFQMHQDLSVMVADLSGIEYRMLGALPPDTEVVLKIQEKDYFEVLSNLEFDGQGGAYYSVAAVSDYETIPDPLREALVQASEGDDFSGIISFIEGFGVVQESLQEALRAGQKQEIKRLGLDKVERLVTNYITNRSMSSRVPVLIGNTAVAKSALVKGVAKKLGYRMVDFRCAFLDKMDIEGFRKQYTDPETNALLSTTAPPEKLLECTDDYLDYAEATAKELKRKLAEISDEDEARAVQKVINLLEEKARPPVLFFDEVTRATNSVQNAFVQILNQKRYRGMKFSKARVIAATNFPVDMEGQGLDFQSAYLTTEIEDAGIVERYEPVIVRALDVTPRWFEFIEGRGAFDKAVVDFLKKNTKYAYDLQHVIDTVKAGMPGALTPSGIEEQPLVSGEDDVGVIPFPNFRTWEFVSDHLKSVRRGDIYFDETLIRGFIGRGKAATDFIKYAKDTVPQASNVPDGTDFLTDSLRAGMKSGTPTLLLGMTSIGKTSRVKRIANDIGARVVTVNLAQMDRVDVQGAPASLSVSETFAQEAGGSLPPDVMAILNRNVQSKLTATPHITRMLPDFHLAQSIKSAREAGQKVVLFFDEINRADKNTMSAVLEAVSDQRFGGVAFPWLCKDESHGWSGPRDDLERGLCPLGHEVEPQVVIVAAANYGENYSNVEKMDPAISGRFSVLTKTEFDDTDKKAILDYMRTNKDPEYPQVLIQFIKSKTVRDLKLMLSSVEGRSITEAAPSLRAWSDVAKMMNQVEDPALRGELPGEIWEESMRRGARSLDDLEKLIWDIPDNWAGLLGDQTVTIGDEEYTIPQFVQEMKSELKRLKEGTEGTSWFGGARLTPDDVQSALTDFNDWLYELSKVNQEVRRYREQEFVSKFGRRYTDQFLPFYNNVIGKTLLDIKDVVSRDKAWKYGRQLVEAIDNPNEIYDAMKDYMESFYDTFGESTSPDLYGHVLDAVVKQMPNRDKAADLLLLYTKDGYPLVRGFLNRALTAETTMSVAAYLRVAARLDKDEVEDYYKRDLHPKGTDGHPPKMKGGSP